MMGPLRALVLAAALAPSALAAPFDARALPACGDVYFQARQGAPPPRGCALEGERTYRPRYEGLAYEILDLESEACFVSDDSYRLLDRIMDEIHAEIGALGFARGDAPTAALLNRMGEITVDALVRNGFRLYIGTRTIGDALTAREAGAQHYYPFDCDIGALILLTVAQHYGVPGWLVEIRLSEQDTHNYVRWALAGGEIMDWDTNARGPCATRGEHPPWQGRAWSHDEVVAYILSIRAGTWRKQNASDRELADLQRAMELAPAHPNAFNNYAWLVATRPLADRAEHAARAHAAALHAISLERSGNYLDTLACVVALRGDFPRAAAIEREALQLVRSYATAQQFRDRIARFTASPPRDCTGDD
ncbi:MAG: hypothetical protein AB7Q23_05970 [Hyphomonadaceae bacterium]